MLFFLSEHQKKYNFAFGEMAERSIAAVLKTVDCNRSGGSNPSFSASEAKPRNSGAFVFLGSESSLIEFAD